MSLNILPSTRWHSIKNSVLGILTSCVVHKGNDFVSLKSGALEAYGDLTLVPGEYYTISVSLE